MTTKEWGVLSFLVGIAVAGLLREVPSSIFWIAVGSFSCSLIAYGVWHFYIHPSQNIHTRSPLDG